MDFKKGDVTLKVKSINECSLLPVPSSRMKDTYTFNDGKSSGEESGGFAAGVSAKQMNWIIVPRSVPIAVISRIRSRLLTLTHTRVEMHGSLVTADTMNCG